MKDQSALLLIEFQNEWLAESGKLNKLVEDKDMLNQSVTKAKQALAHARDTQQTVIHSGLSFSADYRELGVAKHGLRKHIVNAQTFLASESGSEFYEDFKPRTNEFVVSGRSGSSAFAGSNLESYLRNNQINTLYIMGYALHVCIESTMRQAHDLGYEVYVIEDACSAFNKEQHDYVLNNIVSHFAQAITVAEFKSMNK